MNAHDQFKEVDPNMSFPVIVSISVMAYLMDSGNLQPEYKQELIDSVVQQVLKDAEETG